MRKQTHLHWKFLRLTAGLLVFSMGLTALPAVCAQAESPGLSSLSAVLYEPESGRVIFEKDAHTPRPMASTTKIMTALLAAEKCSPEQMVTIPKQAVMVEGSSLGLKEGDQISMRDLITGLLLESGNDAANTIALTVSGSLEAFAVVMNERAAELGMKNSTFVTPSGLDQGNHSSSAYDMALLAAEVMRNDMLAEICAQKKAVIHLGNPVREATVSNHNRLLSLYPYAVGMKTGFTKKSGRCLVSAARKDGVLLIAVTLNGGDYWNDHMALYNAGFEKVESVDLTLPELPNLAVSGGMTGYVQLRCETPPAQVLMKEEAGKVSVRVELPPFTLAPVISGQRVGTVRYLLEGRELCALPLTAAYPVDARPVAGYTQRFWEWFRELFAELAC